MTSIRLEFTYKALDDLKWLRAFIAKKIPAAAKRYSERFMKSIRHLQTHAKLGSVVEYETGVYEHMANDYVIRYHYESAIVTILGVWHEKEERTSQSETN